MQEDEFLTLAAPCEAEIKIKGSKFLGHAVPVETRIAAEEFITEISKRCHDATHNCFAYRIGIGNAVIFRHSDAGEPAGTAGAPIYNVIEGRNLSNMALVITRYFGGTKLGKGGLIRAYSDCTRATLARARIIKKYIYAILNLNFGYNLTGDVMRVISRMEAKVVESSYGAETNLKVQIRKSLADSFRENLIDATGGKIKFS